MPITYVSWNIQYLGPSKLNDEKQVLGTQVITAMADCILQMRADIVVIMEVTLKEAGTDAVGQLCEELGENWDGGSSSNSAYLKPDRYGLLFNKNTVQFRGQNWPDTDAAGNRVSFPNRTPGAYYFTTTAGMDFGVMILHCPNPTEDGGRAALTAMAGLARLDLVRNRMVQGKVIPMLISGDFNVDYNANPAPYQAFTNFGYTIGFQGQLTSLKTKFETKENPGTYLKSAYDNIFYSPELGPQLVGCGVFDYVGLSGQVQRLPAYTDPNCTPEQKRQWQRTLTEWRRVSDHLPVGIKLNI